MSAEINNKLPFGNLPRLLLAWVCTEAVRTGSREIILGKSLSEFMRKLDILSSDSSGTTGVRTRLRNQMNRLFHASVQLIYEDDVSKVGISSFVADRTEFGWNERKPAEPVLWESRIHLSEAFFNEIISHPVPLSMNILTALKRSPLGLDLYLLACLTHLRAEESSTAYVTATLPAARNAPVQVQRQIYRPELPPKCSPRVAEDQAGLAGVELHNGSGRLDPAFLEARDPSGTRSPAPRGIAPRFLPQEGAR